MQVSTEIPCGNGRVLRATPESIEVELIAYSKGARYTAFAITDITENRRQKVVLYPDRFFLIPGFPYKFHSHVWVKTKSEGVWRPLDEVERLPEKVNCYLDLEAGEEYTVCTEPFRTYAETTRMLADLAREQADITRLHCIGISEEQRPIFLLRVGESGSLSDPGEEQKPLIQIVCGEHATEFAGEEIGRGMLALVLGSDAEGARLRREYLFDFILNVNPDGNVHGWHQYNSDDWRGHNYLDKKDRSWHHQFAPYLCGEEGDYSAETVAFMEWTRKTRPAFHISLHSWEGHDGAAGAYYTDPADLSEEMGRRICVVNEIAQRAAAGVGEEFIAKSSPQQSIHLAEFLMKEGLALAYLPEGHYNWGREKLQSFGRRFLLDTLSDPRITLSEISRAGWGEKTF